MKKYFLVVFVVFLLTASCGSGNSKSSNDDSNDSIKKENYKPEKFTEEQEKDDMI